MNVLLIGKGAREHALAVKLNASPLLRSLSIWPGHAAMRKLGTLVDLSPDAPLIKVVEWAKESQIDLVVAGPEAPLMDGLADLCAEKKIAVFGPKKVGAWLEGSKAFAKEIMQKAKVPTADFVLANGEAECRKEALRMLAERGGTVLKASGLAAGKGVFVCKNAAEIEAGIRRLYHSDMSAAAATVVIESTLVGRECSYFTFLGTGGATSVGFAVDHKRLGDGDTGPNTGGMGCYAPVPWLPENADEVMQEKIVAPLVRTLAHEAIDYTGCLFIGVMWTKTGPSVIEFNVRLGDPEAQVLSLVDDRDWLALMAFKAGLTADPKTVAAFSMPFVPTEKAVVVVMASADYPYGEGPVPSESVLPADLFDAADRDGKKRARVFAASVKAAGGGIVAAKGRALTVCARSETFAAARATAYQTVDEIKHRWPDAQVRRDIALLAEHEEARQGGPPP